MTKPNFEATRLPLDPLPNPFRIPLPARRRTLPVEPTPRPGPYRPVQPLRVTKLSPGNPAEFPLPQPLRVTQPYRQA